MNANGSDKRQWTTTGNTYGSPAWSPNGATLAITVGGQYGYLETTSGTIPEQALTVLTGTNEDWYPPTKTKIAGWNPSWIGDQIAMTAYNMKAAAMCEEPEGSGTFGETCVDVYNTATRKFSFVEAGNDGCDGGNDYYQDVAWPSLSPSGTNILFQYDNPANDNCKPTPWYVAATKSKVATKAGDQQAEFSPNGDYIVLANALPGKTANIIIETAKGTDRRTLTVGYQPSWQPVG